MGFISAFKGLSKNGSMSPSIKQPFCAIIALPGDGPIRPETCKN